MESTLEQELSNLATFAQETLGLKGKELTDFLRDERAARREEQREMREAARKQEEQERAAQLQKEDERRKEEERQKQREHETHMLQQQIEMEKVKADAAVAQAAIPQTDQRESRPQTKYPKLPYYNEKTEDMDAYLERFERYAKMNNWPEDKWATSLSTLLHGTALQVFYRMDLEDARDYKKLKTALLKRFQMTDEGFKDKFRSARPVTGESFSEFVTRIQGYLNRWLELAEVAKTYDAVHDLMIEEQVLNICTPDLKIHIMEKKPKTLKDMSTHAEQFLKAHGKLYGKWSSQSADSRRGNDKRQTNVKSEDGKHPQTEEENSKENNKGCWICGDTNHFARNCKKRKQEPSKIKVTKSCFICGSPDHWADKCPAKSSKQSGSSGSTKSTTEASKAFSSVVSCIKLSDGTEVPIHTSEDGSLYVEGNSIVAAALRKSATDFGILPIKPGCINGQPAEIMRDTGCTGVMVSSKYCKEEEYIGRTALKVVDGNIKFAPLAKVNIQSPYFSGDAEAMVMDSGICEGIVGNIPGAKLPMELKVITGKQTTQGEPEEVKLEVCHVMTRAQTEAKQQEVKGKRRLKPLKVMETQGLEVTKDDMQRMQREDQDLEKIRKLADNDEQKPRGRHEERFQSEKGLLYRIYMDPRQEDTEVKQLILPKKLRESVLEVAHDAILGGHLGTQKTLDRVRAHFHWPGITGDVTRYCQSCDICQRTIDKGRVGKAHLGKMPVIRTPFERVAVDLIGPLPLTTSGNRFALTVMDYATRYPDAKALRGITTIEVAEGLLEIFSHVGFPKEMLSDQGTQFMSELMHELTRLVSIKQLTTTPYHPMCNGLVEGFNGTLKRMLKRLAAERVKDWDRYLTAVLFAYREVPQDSTHFSPFELLYGRTVRGPLTILREVWTAEEIPSEEEKTTYQYVFDLRQRLENTCELAHEELRKAQQTQKKYYNKRARYRKLEIGNKALVLLPTEHSKLQMRWKGPFDVVSRHGENDYGIDVEGKKKIFHINMLKKYEERKPREEEAKIAVCIGSSQLQFVDGIEDLEICATVDVEIPADEDDTEMFYGVKAKESWKDVKLDSALSPTESGQLKDLLQKYSDVLTDLPGRTDLLEFELELVEHRPFRCKPYPVPLHVKEAMRMEVELMCKLGVIEDSVSEYASPPLIVPKPDGNIRYCIDFRKLNSVTRFDSEPIPSQESLIGSLGGSRYFSKLDLTKGFWQIPIRPEHRKYTAFMTEQGLKQCSMMPFGLVNASAVFCRMMRKLLNGMTNVDSYIDDVIVHSLEWQDHLKTLDELMSRLRKHGLKARPSKCEMGCSEVKLLGHVVGKGMVKPQENKVSAILKAPRPCTKKEIKSFLGHVGYYQKFIPRYAEVCWPLTELQKKGKPMEVAWSEDAEKAYQHLKNAVACEPVLKLPRLDVPFTLRTDASDKGLGAMLCQEYEEMQHPICYISRKLRGAEQRYSVIEKECLAVVWGIKRLHTYLFGREFYLETDHQPLAYVNRSSINNGRIMRWALSLQPYRFVVKIVKGETNHAADFLSRCCG